MTASGNPITVAVVIPSYKVRKHILSVIGRIGPEVARIYVVDDCCPEDSGNFVTEHCTDQRIRVLKNLQNTGVGGAVMAGYRAAIADGADIIVKIDGDAQMDPALLPQFIAPIVDGWADYTKGNRFYNLTHIHRMPKLRLVGNAVLSFISKASTGYWNVFDPTNGYTAIDSRVAAHLPFDKISNRYFFETDMLFRLNTLRAVIADIPMDAVYGEEESNLKISQILGEFMGKHARNFLKRIVYNYFLRDTTAATFELLCGILLLLFGSVYGVVNWISSYNQHIATPTGTIMLSALPVIVGLQLVLAFLNFDVANLPSRAVSALLPDISIRLPLERHKAAHMNEIS